MTIRVAGLHALAPRGILVELVDDRGTVGYGEASPLPGYSPDSEEDCRAALAALPRDCIDARRIPASLPAARFALETALLDLAARRAGIPLFALLGPAHEVPLCSLVYTPAQAITAYTSRGIRTIKCKIGPGDDGLAARVRDAVPDATLRLDANRSLPDADAGARLVALAALGPELIEEPCRDLRALGARPPVPIAVDESLGATIPDLPISAIVLKPALHGGLTRCLDLARAARARGLDVIVTHMFDGPIAVAAAAALALVVATRPCGLDRHADRGLPFLHGAMLAPGDWPGLGVQPWA